MSEQSCQVCIDDIYRPITDKLQTKAYLKPGGYKEYQRDMDAFAQ